MGKHFQVLEAHQKVDTFEVLIRKKARFWLYYVIRKILESLSSFVYVNEKFCNKNLFDLLNIVLESFPRFYTAYIIYIEAIVLNYMHWERVGGAGNAKKKKKKKHVWDATGNSWSQQSAGNAKIMLLLVLGRDRRFPVTTEFFSIGLGRNKCFLGCDRAFWLYFVTWFSLCHDMVLSFKL